MFLKSSRPWLSGLALALLAACSPKAPEPDPPRSVRTQVLQPVDLRVQHVYAAELRARTESRLAFRVPGKVASREVGLGQRVKAGQLLMRLDPRDLKLATEAAEAGMLAAKVQRDQQAADLKRFIELKAQGFISGAELERRQVAFEAAQAQFTQARVQWRAQANQNDYGELRADADGVITAIDVEPGSVVAAGTPVLRLAQSGPLDAVFQVPEQHIDDLREQAASGQLQVRVGSGAGQEQVFAAKLREVAQQADAQTRTFLVKADLGAQPALRLGQTATVELQSAAAPGVLRVPMSAIFESQGKPQVWVLDGTSMTLKARAIEVGGADGNQVVVAGGLSAGEEVVTAGTHVLAAGQKVRRYGAASAAPAPAASR